MKVLILGATGPTGGHVLTNALEGGDTVTVLARRPEALAAADELHQACTLIDQAHDRLNAAMTHSDRIV